MGVVSIFNIKLFFRNPYLNSFLSTLETPISVFTSLKYECLKYFSEVSISTVKRGLNIWVSTRLFFLDRPQKYFDFFD